MDTYERHHKPEDNTYGSLDYYNKLKALPHSVVINENTDDECIFVREKDTGVFPITSLSREDFGNIGYDGDNIPDDAMEYLADKMGDFFCEYGGFWDYLREYAEDNNLPKTYEQ